jgi:hypothetical protein
VRLTCTDHRIIEILGLRPLNFKGCLSHIIITIIIIIIIIIICR